MTCTVPDSFPPLITAGLDHFAKGSVLVLSYTPRGGIHFRLVQPVENPSWVGVTHAAGDVGDRIYSGIPLKAHARSVTFTDSRCPAQPTGSPTVEYPWRAGGDCLKWTLLDDKLPAEQVIECANTTDDFRGKGWDRYRESCDQLMPFFRLPIDLQCARPESGEMRADCVMNAGQVSLRLDCEVEGGCSAVRSPPPPPASPPHVRRVSCFDASSTSHDLCWTLYSYGYLAISLLSAVIFPFFIFASCRLLLRLRRDRVAGTHSCSLCGGGGDVRGVCSGGVCSGVCSGVCERVVLHGTTQPLLLNSLLVCENSCGSRLDGANKRLETSDAISLSASRPNSRSASRTWSPRQLHPIGPQPSPVQPSQQSSLQPPRKPRSGGRIALRAASRADANQSLRSAPCEACVQQLPSRGPSPQPRSASTHAPVCALAPLCASSDARGRLQSDGAHAESSGAADSGVEGAWPLQPASLQLSWRGVSYAMGKRAIVQRCSHALLPGLSCLIGPSGAGKSSLLGVLAGRKRRGAVGGDVLLNGTPTDAATRRQLIGYVTQEDVLPGTSTVEEHLVFHAAVRCHWLCKSLRSELVWRTLHSLQLAPKAGQQIGDAHVRGLSGGERRRVSVAVELLVLAAPPPDGDGGGVLLMDEPLSGLDSVNARLVLAALCALTRPDAPPSPPTPPSPQSSASPQASASPQSSASPLPPPSPRTLAPSVLLSVHQPTHRFLEEMVGVLVMANGGRMLYAGARLLADGSCALSATFDSANLPRLRELSPNPAEALLEALADPSDEMRAHVETLISRRAQTDAHDGARGFDRGDEPARRDGAHNALTSFKRSAAKREACFLLQFVALSDRHCTLALRHPLLIWVNLGTVVVISLLSGVAFWQNGKNYDLDTGILQRIGLLFFLMLVFTLTALINITMWHQERLLYFQERGASCYGPLAYICSKLVYDLVPLRVVPSLLCAAIVYPMAGLRSDGPYPTDPDSDAIGPSATLLFALGLALANCVGSTMFNAIGIVCRSSTVAVQLAVLLALYSFLFCGLLVNRTALDQLGQKLGGGMAGTLSLLPSTSFVFHFIELVLVNELAAPPSPIVTIAQRHIPGVPKLPKDAASVPGPYILEFLGFATGDTPDESCLLTIPCSSWTDLQVLVVWLVCGQLCCYFLLRFCVSDPH